MSSTRTLRTRQVSSSQHDVTDKENSTKTRGPKTEAKPKSKTSAKGPKVFCTCRQPDDGSPMILCSECKEWYHFKCIELDEREAEDIQVYVCPSCHTKTGLRTVMEWEGPDAIEARTAPPPIAGPSTQKVVAETEPKEEEPKSESDDGDKSDYVVRRTAKRRVRAHPASSDTDTDSDSESRPKSSRRMRRQSEASTSTRTRTVSASPGPSVPLKRRQSTASHPPEPKRKRSESAAGAGIDAARKYCLTKLQELFRGIFLQYPILGDTESREGEIVIDKKKEDLTAEEQTQLEEKAGRFATELEECMFELYAEPDVKTGKNSVATKYKERFRMLTFNLSKPDRVTLHKRIASSRLSPSELATMSSTDLADEETKQSIKQAEQEALAQTILKKVTLPRAKMTHKGMQDIEDVSGSAERDRERERELEEEERIERERQERLRLQAQKAQARASQPPDSPMTPVTPSWGAPPPIPLHALHGNEPGSPTVGRPPVHPLFLPSSSDIATPVEHELNLADLINIDEEPGQEVSISLASPSIATPSTHDGALSDPRSPAEASSQSPVVPSTGISPFASRSAHPELTSRPSFDLSALWSPKDDGSGAERTEGEKEDHEMEDATDQAVTASPLGVEIITEEANDKDFDMFLNGGDDEETVAPPAVESTPKQSQATFDAQPLVWNGKISMPLDSTIPQEVAVTARQVGGRSLGHESLLWRTLFPVEHLRIDGRVPVDKSAEYLTQSRLNPGRELIAVAFAPESEASAANFEALSKFLTAKGRHGLIFPWGNRPKEHHPGRELYIVPLVSSEPIPDFIELLDELQLPKVRTANYMIGIWVLNRGKLAPPPTPVAAPPPPSPQSQPPSALSTMLSQLPGAPLQPAAPVQPPPPAPAVSPPAPVLDSSALAAEVASLTPEQIQLMLRTLSASSSLPIPQVPAPPLPPPQTIPPPAVPLQPWMSAPPPFPPSFPPSSISPPPPPPHGPPYGGPPFDADRRYPPPPPHDSPPPFDPYSNDRGSHVGNRGGGGRGRRGGRGNWDRGRNHHNNQPSPSQDRPRDSGWGGRGRGRGRGGPPSPQRDQGWGGSPQRW